ncbi:hypothetical protein L3X38_000368 [Prunus dulcis]|uniref:Uncharacterized protein n=1 Tax=Prunus dulcis TaxID=3755 RepID=A0AAD4YJB0_PRUDU|nr:hypothetical protein L3X38_000368 [Prunus dulcis]
MFCSSLLQTSLEIVICSMKWFAHELVHQLRGKEIMIFLFEVQVICTSERIEIKLGGLLIRKWICSFYAIEDEDIETLYPDLLPVQSKHVNAEDAERAEVTGPDPISTLEFEPSPVRVRHLTNVGHK